MSIAVNDKFAKGGINLISCHSPLVVRAAIYNTTAAMSSGDAYVTIQGASPTENTDSYDFDMGWYATTVLGGGYYWHYFELNVTDIIRNICNDPQFESEAAAEVIKQGSRMACPITITVKSAGETNNVIDNFYAHGFNQVNNPYDSCLAEFGNPSVDGCVIPIVPGAPMVFYAWVPTTGSSLNVDGLIYKGATLLNTISVTSSPVESLYGFYYPAGINTYIYNASNNKPEEFRFLVREVSVGTDYCDQTLVAFKKACEGDVVLAWLNRYGTYSYMAFERFPTYDRNQKSMGEYDIQVIGLSDVQSRKKSRGYEEVQTTISAVAKNIPVEYFSAIEDLFYSMDVYYYTGTLPKHTFDAAEWLRVTVSGRLTERRKRKHENVRVDIMLPEKYTQVR